MLFKGLGSKCQWGQSVCGVKVSEGQTVGKVKLSLGSNCRQGQSVFWVNVGVSRLYLVFILHKFDTCQNCGQDSANQLNCNTLLPNFL